MPFLWKKLTCKIRYPWPINIIRFDSIYNGLPEYSWKQHWNMLLQSQLKVIVFMHVFTGDRLNLVNVKVYLYVWPNRKCYKRTFPERKYVGLVYRWDSVNGGIIDRLLDAVSNRILYIIVLSAQSSFAYSKR